MALKCILITGVLLALAGHTGLNAQEDADSVTVLVTDPGFARVPDAAITIVNRGTNATARGKTNKIGRAHV